VKRIGRLGPATFGLLLVVGLSACKRGANEILIINTPWSVQSAEADCKSRASLGIPLCNGSPEDQIRRNVVEIFSAFRSDPACDGITLQTLEASTDKSQSTLRDTWWLFLELSRGEEDRLVRYKVSHSNNPDAPYSLTGTADTKQAAHSACEFVHGELGVP
jgi:hypothetical protein